jgi:uncharacterized protein YegJ (DUF2314 family)
VNFIKQYPLLAGFFVFLLAGLWLSFVIRRRKLMFYEIPEDDGEMKQASQQARETLEDFLRILREPKKGQNGFSIKGRFQQGDIVEHIWIDDPKEEGSELLGNVGNDPVHIPGIKGGQSVRVRKSELSDWMFVEGGVLRGGFTIRVHFLRQPPKTRRKLLKDLPFRIPELERWQAGGIP